MTMGVRQAKRVKEKELAGGRNCKCKGPEVGTAAAHLSPRELSTADARRIGGLTMTRLESSQEPALLGQGSDFGFIPRAERSNSVRRTALTLCLENSFVCSVAEGWEW